MYRKNKRYNKLHITETTILAVDALLDLGLIEHHKGHYVREGQGASHMSRMQAKPELISLIEEHGWKETMVDKAPGTECIILHDYDKERDRQVDVDYVDTKQIIQMREDLCRYNSLLRRTFIDIPEFPEGGVLPESGGQIIQLNRANKFVRRIFNNRSWGDGGRFYGPWWQNVPKEWRDKIRIEDEQTIELDYSGLHIILLYAQQSLDYWRVDGEDTYQLPSYQQTEAFRGLLKFVLLTAINVKDIESAVKAVQWQINQDREKFEWVRESGIDLKRLVEDFTDRHQPIRNHFFTGIGVQLQNIDAKIAEEVINELSVKVIPVLTIHDSFIVTRQNEEHLQEAMTRAIQKVVTEILGTNITDKVKRSIDVESVTTVATVAVATSDKVNVIGDKTTTFTVIPVATSATSRFRRLEVQEEQLVRAILKHIGESNPTCVEEVLGQCRTNPDALKFWLERSKDLPGQTQPSDVSCGDCCQFKRAAHPHWVIV